ncbi:sigma-70 family RNA polymerase sigma factor [candidate division KSB3 bacterium]|uniref:Sigma-70 family RNA polymerase sigma factor n=1 Tax=candidate division KSB3 bacterium TaxID=2044937 RepID=A0A9D5Q4R2_9BACT|nr:sigma-70 family RNA polymerase sigma factor [candidate division KSB3 bacterium]MBD3323984.1 sigma-70 family RNA polymerase sigma factor [candidate division KSB3 bacterium]
MSETTLNPYFKALQHYPPMSHEDEVALIHRFREGDDTAAEKLVTSHLRFVVTIAKGYQYLGLPLADLINEGNVGLLRALYKFDETRGIKFSSYASWLIKRQIFQAVVDQSKMVRIPTKQILALLKQRRKLQLLASQLRHHDVNTETLRHVEQKIDRIKRQLHTTSPSYLSLDAPISEENPHAFTDLMTADDATQPDEVVSRKIHQEFLYQGLSELDERERTIIELYYGLYAQQPQTLKEIGQQFRITRERVRQIKEKALDKLRKALTTSSWHN